MVWDPLDLAWQEGLEVCRAYAVEFGSIATVKGSDTYRGFRLGTWLNSRRQDQKEGKLNPERTAALDELGIAWEPRKARTEKALALCQAYAEEHGSIENLTRKEIFRGFPLGSWLGHRREQRRVGKLPSDVAAALDSLGIDWDPSRGSRRLNQRSS